jgi:glyceraldehyde-3-phosphate dehydrogenase/erythrose-4-phosphate dehydrogenase
MTRVVGGNLVKVLGWYDNEMGYTYTLVDHVIIKQEEVLNNFPFKYKSCRTT